MCEVVQKLVVMTVTATTIISVEDFQPTLFSRIVPIVSKPLQNLYFVPQIHSDVDLLVWHNLTLNYPAFLYDFLLQQI